MPLQVNAEYVAEVLQRLTSNPTAQDLDYLVQSYATIGYYAAQMQGDSELAESERKYGEAESYRQGKELDQKATQAALEALAAIKTRDLRRAEIKARTNALKMKNLWLSIEQTINAIKFLQRNDSYSNGVRMGQ